MYLGGREMVHGIKWVKVTNAALRKQSLGQERTEFHMFSAHLTNSSKHKCHKSDGKHIRTFEKSHDFSDQHNEQTDGTTATEVSNNRSNIILQTATAVVFNINHSETLQVQSYKLKKP